MNFTRGFATALVLLAAFVLAPSASAAAPPQVISEPGVTPYSPRLEMTPGGRAYIAWLGHFEEQPGTPTFSQVVSIGPDGPVTQPTTLGGPGADIAVGSSEDLTTVWEAERDDFRLQRVAPDGSTGPSVFLAANPDRGRGSWGSPGARVAVGPDGTATVAWIDRRGDVLARRVPAAGPLGGARVLGEADPGLGVDDIAVAVDAENRTTLAFASSRDRLRIVGLAPDGSVARRAAIRSFDGWDVRADFAPSGRGLLAWRSPTGMQAARVRPAGKPGKPIRISNSKNRRLFEPRVSVARDGRALVGWTSQREGRDGEPRREVVYVMLGPKGEPTAARSVARRARAPDVAFGRGARDGAAISFVTSSGEIGLLGIGRSGRTRTLATISGSRSDRRGAMNLGFDDEGRAVLAWLERGDVMLARP